jgi:hypothetical protein
VRRPQPRWRSRRFAPAAVVALLMLLVAAPAAFGQDSTISIEVRDEAGNVVPRISAEGMYPTLTVRHMVFIAVDGGAPTGRVGTDIVNLVDYENGCNRPEINAGDTTCADPGPGEGELSEQLEITWTVGSVVGGGCILGDVVGPQGQRLRDVVDTPVDLGDLPASRQLCFEVAQEFLDLPENNLAQTDSATFDIRVGIQQITARFSPPGAGENGAAEEVAGVVVERPATPGASIGVGPGTSTTITAGTATPGIRSGGPLARTGASSTTLVLLAVGYLLVGAATAFEGSRRAGVARAVGTNRPAVIR